MDATITIKGIEYGEIRKTKYTLKVPDFKPKQTTLGQYTFNISENDQLQDWFDQNYDDLVVNYCLQKFDVWPILDASIVFRVTKKRKTRQEQFREILKEIIPEKLIPDFIACYIEMKDAIKGLTLEKQIQIVLRSMSIGYQASSNALKSITEFSQKLSTYRLGDE